MSVPASKIKFSHKGQENMPPDVSRAFEICERLARRHYENFPVATRLLPAEFRIHLYSVYAFCRGTDDLGDEADGNRLALLDKWEQQLDTCYRGTSSHPYFIALQSTIEKFEIPAEPFLRLIDANRRDQYVHRYSTFSELLDYCNLSANPVGHIVLYIFGYKDKERQNASDSTCTALQLANFLQDITRDYGKGRVYIPLEDMYRFGVGEDVIESRRMTEGFRHMMRLQVERTRDMFSKGCSLLDMVDGRLKVDLALFTLGGLEILRRIEKQNFDVLVRRPKIPRMRFLRMFLSVFMRSRLGFAPIPASAFQYKELRR